MTLGVLGGARARNVDTTMVVRAHDPGWDTASRVLVTSNLAGDVALRLDLFRPQDWASWMGCRVLDTGRVEAA